MSGLDLSLSAPFMGVEADHLERVFEVIDERWGGTEGYLRSGLGLCRAELDAVRELLVET